MRFFTTTLMTSLLSPMIILMFFLSTAANAVEIARTNSAGLEAACRSSGKQGSSAYAACIKKSGQYVLHYNEIPESPYATQCRSQGLADEDENFAKCTSKLEQAAKESFQAQLADAGEEDSGKCIDYGFKKGSDGYARCRMMLENDREDRRALAERIAIQASQEAAQRESDAVMALGSALLFNSTRPARNPFVNCSTNYSRIGANTTCW